MHKITRPGIYGLLFLAFVIHITLLDRITIFGWRPDILLSCVLFVGLYAGPRIGTEAGIAAGLLKDIYTFDVFGVNTFIMALTGLLAGAVRSKFFKESKMTQVILVFTFSIFTMMLHFTIYLCASRYPGLTISEYFSSSVLPSSVYTSLVCIPIFLGLANMFGLKEDNPLL